MNLKSLLARATKNLPGMKVENLKDNSSPG